ncbi:MAG: putative DNA-binding domain-containing protein [Gammaproteobacteria bacterium]|nr:putative DNA-binding domain-containing protein [Gammaproteobacteria bacterium]
MPELRQLQQSFMGYLLGEASPVVEQIESSADTSAQQRLDIYATGYRLRLKEAIMSDYGRLHFYLGDESFELLMDRYIDKYHSPHTSLRYYSEHIEALLAEHKPFSEVPELVEIARIERAFNDSFDSANCNTMKIEQLAQIQPEDWPEVHLQFHSSLKVLPCEYNSFPIWKALSEEETPPTLVKENSSWIVWRKELVSRYRTLSDEEADALNMAMAGGSFGEICKKLLDHFDEETTPQQAIFFLQTWINEKMVCQLSV